MNHIRKDNVVITVEMRPSAKPAVTLPEGRYSPAAIRRRADTLIPRAMGPQKEQHEMPMIPRTRMVVAVGGSVYAVSSPCW